MDYAAQKLGGHPFGAIGGIPTATAQRTLAQRLDQAAQTIQGQCSRVEDTISRIHGTPRTGSVEKAAENSIRPSTPLAQSVELVEALAKRLADLASTLEQVA